LLAGVGPAFRAGPVFPLKSNRKIALSLEHKQQGHCALVRRNQRIDTLDMEPDTVREIYLDSASHGGEVPFPLLLCNGPRAAQQIFTAVNQRNEDGSTGVLYLVTSDTTLQADGPSASDQIQTYYKRGWKVEEYHSADHSRTSLKQNASLAKSPTRTKTTQTNHSALTRRFICLAVRLCQARTAQNDYVKEPFCLKDKTLCQSTQVSL
jgi:hypothetical protein